MWLIVKKIYNFRYYKEGDQSESIGLDELFAHTQEIVLLVGCFLNDVKESILHHDFSNVHELFIEQQPLVIRVIFFVVDLIRGRFILS